jgi:hypothetical protein
MGQCVFRDKNIDNPPPYNEITASKINKAIDKDTFNKLRAQKLKEIDEKYYDYLNEIIENTNRLIIDEAISKNVNIISQTLNFFQLKYKLGIDCNHTCQEYYKRLIDDMFETYKQYKPVKCVNQKYTSNLCNYKIVLRLWSTNKK